ncbi:MAG: VOC family protein [Proteobacteria bacterium]|nr:VOC family protein [Pseudomonadota bacterium]
MVRGFHHVAFACQDPEQTRHFYEDLLGFPLVHTEVAKDERGQMKHLFFDLGDGSSMAFFFLQGMGVSDDYPTAVSTDLGLPVWVNHVAFKADAARKSEVQSTMASAGIQPLMEVDHDWCQSLYYLDPNGIMVEFCEDTPGITPDRQNALALIASD